MTTIDWYQCDSRDCEPGVWIADERDGQPAFSVWFERYFKDFKWRWAAWDGSEGATSQEMASGKGYDTQAAAMRAAEQWLDNRAAPQS